METQITVQDLARLKSIVETACTRGAFQAAEMRIVGEVYEKLCAFLNSAATMTESQSSNIEGESND
jgi:hypothetical protein